MERSEHTKAMHATATIINRNAIREFSTRMSAYNKHHDFDYEHISCVIKDVLMLLGQAYGNVPLLEQLAKTALDYKEPGTGQEGNEVCESTQKVLFGADHFATWLKEKGLHICSCKK